MIDPQDERNFESDDYVDALYDAVSDFKTILAMDGEYSDVEYRKMAELEADGKAVELLDYRKDCRFSLLRSWFTTADGITDYVTKNNAKDAKK